MKLNFVLSYTNGQGKHFATDVQLDTSLNLFNAFEPYKQYKCIGMLDTIQYVSSKKKAVELAQVWNDCYKRNGTLNDNLC